MPISSGWREAADYLGAGAIGFPIAVLLHELGHFLVYSAFGFADVSLRYDSVSWVGSQHFWRLVEVGNFSRAAAVAVPWQVAIGVAAGPLATTLTVLICVWLSRRSGPSPVVLGVGLVAPLRWVGFQPVAGHGILGQDVAHGLDERRFAMLTGVPESLLLALGLVVLVAAWVMLVASIPQPTRLRRVAPAIAGMSIGGFLWFGWIGTLLLP